MGLGWWLVGPLAFISVVGIPWGRACFVIGQLAFLPFGRAAIDRNALTGQEDIGTGALGRLGNVVWFLFAGLWLAMMCFITVIGIPFGIQHLKLAGIALAPVGKSVVPIEVADAIARSKAVALPLGADSRAGSRQG